MRRSLGLATKNAVTDANGEEQPEIQRRIRKAAVLRVDERRDAMALCAKLLNTKVARRMTTQEERMVEAGSLPPLERSRGFRELSLSAFRRPQATGDAGTRTTFLDNYRARPIAEWRLSTYEFVSRMGDAPVFAGEALRRQ